MFGNPGYRQARKTGDAPGLPDRDDNRLAMARVRWRGVGNEPTGVALQSDNSQRFARSGASVRARWTPNPRCRRWRLQSRCARTPRAKPTRRAAMAKPKVWYENPPGAGPPQGLYTHVGFVQGGTLAFIAGQLAVGSKGEVIGKGDFRAQFRQVFSNLRDVLSGMGPIAVRSSNSRPTSCTARTSRIS